MRNSPGFSQFIDRDPLQPYPHFVLFNKHIIGFRSFEDPEPVRGGGLVLAAVDEASDVRKEDVMKIVWPKLSDAPGRPGRLFITGTLKGENGWLWQMYLKGQDPKQKLVRSWLYPTRTNLVRYSGEQGRLRLEEDRAAVDEATWQQEYECVPSANQGGVFRYFRQCILPDTEPKIPGPRSGFAYVAGCDLGRSRDYTYLVVLECDPTQPLRTGRIVHAEKFPQSQMHEVNAQQVASIARYWRNCTVVVDETGGATGGKSAPDSFVGLYRKYITNVQPFYWGPNNKEQIINELVLHTEQKRLLVYPDQKDVIDQMSVYEFKYTGSRAVFSAPPGFHDDAVSAVAQAVWGMKMGWFTTSAGVPLATGLY